MPVHAFRHQFQLSVLLSFKCELTALALVYTLQCADERQVVAMCEIVTAAESGRVQPEVATRGEGSARLLMGEEYSMCLA